ncbi:MAG: peptidoglycan DD-metalloendopeptidase family protein [Pseudomonadota bacterium]
MKQHIRLVLVSLALIGQPAWADSKSELQSLRERLQKLQQEYRRTRESSAEAADALKQSERAISEAGRRLYQLEREQREVQADLRSATTEAEQASAEIRERQARLNEMIRQAYMRGGGDALKLMLNGENPSQAARDLHYLSYLSHAQLQLIEELKADLGRLAELRQSAAEKDRALAEIREAQLRERENLLREKQERQKVLNRLASEIKKQRKEIATLKRNEQRLSELVARLAKLASRPKTPASRNAPADKPGATGGKPLAVNTRVPEPGRDGTPFSRLKGLLRLPVAGELMNKFGTPREGGGVSWKGLFIRAPEGAEVRAVAGGVVAFADWLRGFGNIVIVDHGEGYMSLYSNNESLYKQAGDPVRMGEAIAAVGNSGGQESPGVYFELRHQSRPINPMTWIK